MTTRPTPFPRRLLCPLSGSGYCCSLSARLYVFWCISSSSTSLGSADEVPQAVWSPCLRLPPALGGSQLGSFGLMGCRHPTSGWALWIAALRTLASDSSLGAC